MHLLEALLYGLVQGLTEFLPISSSAHLRIVPALLGQDDPGAAFTAVIQLGTVVAELLFFRRDLVRIGTRWLGQFRRPELRGTLDARLGWYLIFATIPISVLGLALQDPIETTARSLPLIGSTLIVLGLVLLVADRVGRRERSIEQLSLRDGLVMGSAQALALVPGVSRSGATITAGLLLGLDRYAAARFSFLLSIPAVVLSGLFELKDVVGGDPAGASTGAVIAATVVAGVVGYAVIAFLLRFISTHSFWPFVAYRVALGALVLVLVAAGLIS